MDIWEILTPVLETVLVGVATLAITALSFYLRQWLLAKIGNDKLSIVVGVVRSAVLAVEQMAAQGGWDSAEKKAQAIDIVETWLIENGIQIDADRVAELIEAAVFDELTKWQVGSASG